MLVSQPATPRDTNSRGADISLHTAKRLCVACSRRLGLCAYLGESAVSRMARDALLMTPFRQPDCSLSRYSSQFGIAIATSTCHAHSWAPFQRSPFHRLCSHMEALLTYPRSRTPAPSGSAWFDWVRTMRDVPDKSVLYRQSLDSYLFLRFLRTVIFICLVGCALTWPVLMPVNATGGGTSTQLDSIGIGNVRDGRRLYAHALVAWVFFGFVMFTVARERLWLVGLRQAWTLSKPNAHRLSSRTVLYLSAPRDALEDANMHRFFGDAAVRIWPATKNEELEGLVAARNSKIEQLESVEMALIRKADEKGRSAAKRSGADTVNYNDLSDDVKASVRPNRHLKSGKKVDSIRWLREQVKETESDIDEARNANEIGHPQGAAAVFVEFKTQADAQRASQQVASANLLALTPRHTDIPPGDIIWKNLTIPPARRASQEGLALAIVIAIIIFWSIPSAFVGLVSNIGYLADNVKWLGFLKRLPQPVIGLLSGLLPPLATSALSKFVPNLFRCKLQRHISQL